jgi:hypothetical protein
MLRHFTALVLAAAVSAAGPARALDIVIENLDGPGEGFNDATPVSPVGGNSGTTLGEQRLVVFQTAADIWESILQSPSTDVTITVNATFDALSCDASSAVLGSAGPITVQRDFLGAEFTNTWYHVALANRIFGSDLDPSNADIVTRFNSSIDDNDNCLSGTDWYYGLDGNEGTDTELLPVVLHELGHGLGFSEFVDGDTGELFLGRIDVFSRFLFDEDEGLYWSEMSNAQRVTSARNSGGVVWDGGASTFQAAQALDGLPVLDVTAPGSIAGTVTEIGTASFGPSVQEQSASGPVVLVDDGNGTPSDGCSSATNGTELAGAIALVDRGSCTFVSKAENAQAAGAVGVIIVNNVPGDGPVQMGGVDPGTLTVPTISISFEQGETIKNALSEGVDATIAPDAERLAGASPTTGRLLLYTPDPFQPGSSVSHWDVSASPNLLMEPAINGNLSSDVDLTRFHFEDIGWFDQRVTDAPARVATRLLGNTPNPFNPSTTISFELARAGRVELEVFDAAGRRVKSLVDGTRSSGRYEVQWNGTDDGGRSVASGVYHYRLRADGVDESRSMVLLK